MCEENDFVELDDGRLLMILRTGGAGMHMQTIYLSRDQKGIWTATPPTSNPDFVHSGYPYMLRTSDGVIFYYCLNAPSDTPATTARLGRACQPISATDGQMAEPHRGR